VGNSTLLTVTVTPGTNPASTGIGVTADLSAIGGAPTQTLFDDGTNGDLAIGDNVFSFQATVSGSTSGGLKSLPAVITDAEGRTGNASISLTVLAPTPPSGAGAANPGTVYPAINAADGQRHSRGQSHQRRHNSHRQSQRHRRVLDSGLFDDGTNGDATAGDRSFRSQ
jgi:hypothetical protein